MHSNVRSLGACASLAIATPLFAQPVTLLPAPRPPAPVYGGQDIAAVNATIERFGFDFVTVGAPGNRSWIESERFLPNGWTPNHIDDRGRVDYEYRILRTEVVQTQYVDFVRAFRPFWLSLEDRPGAIESGSPTDNSFTSRGINLLGGFDVDPRYDNSAVTMSWRNAARYANWLHNGAPTDEAALTWDTFHTGAYTLTDESFNTAIRGNPITRNEDARFWLPSLDELLKAAYYDPNRYGEGEEGYWRYPHSSNEEPVRGTPGSGDYGAWDANGNGELEGWESLATQLYPDSVSYWGLLDVLGPESPSAVRELNGEILLVDGDRVLLGEGFAGIDEWSDHRSVFTAYTFRLATIVPAPGVAGALVLSGAFAARRRR
jgi:hypothetical protein